jgi:hypothetical protein
MSADNKFKGHLVLEEMYEGGKMYLVVRDVDILAKEILDGKEVVTQGSQLGFLFDKKLKAWYTRKPTNEQEFNHLIERLEDYGWEYEIKELNWSTNDFLQFQLTSKVANEIKSSLAVYRMFEEMLQTAQERRNEALTLLTTKVCSYGVQKGNSPTKFVVLGDVAVSIVDGKIYEQDIASMLCESCGRYIKKSFSFCNFCGCAVDTRPEAEILAELKIGEAEKGRKVTLSAEDQAILDAKRKARREEIYSKSVEKDKAEEAKARKAKRMKQEGATSTNDSIADEEFEEASRKAKAAVTPQEDILTQVDDDIDRLPGA